MTEHCLTAFFGVNNNQTWPTCWRNCVKLMCVSQIDLRKRRALQTLITDICLECIHSVLSVTFFSLVHTNMKIISTNWFPSGMYLHNWLIHVHAICSSTYMYMKNVNDVTGWLSQTTDISKYFVWSPGLWDKESRLYYLPDTVSTCRPNGKKRTLAEKICV